MRSMTRHNGRFIVIRCAGDSAIYTKQNIEDILSAASKITDEVGAPKGLPKLTDL